MGSSTNSKSLPMGRKRITLLFFLAAVIAIGVYFFKIVQPFLLPLLMAGTMAMLVQPQFAWLLNRVNGRRRVAAIIATVAVVVLVVLPTFVVLAFAAQELVKYGEVVVEEVKESREGELPMLLSNFRDRVSRNDYDELCTVASSGRNVAHADFSSLDEPARALFDQISRFSPEEIERSVTASQSETASSLDSIPFADEVESWLTPYLTRSDIEKVRTNVIGMVQAALAELYKTTASFIADAVGFVIGFVIMMLAFYYFLAEGPTIATELESVLPFEYQDEMAVAKQFETVCRGVVLGTLAAALCQGVLVGVALAFLQVPASWLLACVTVVLAMIPFVGAGAVYTPVSLYLFWDGRYGAGFFLLVYGIVLVSTIDNLIRAHMVHETSRLHPLVALISALGALKLVGLWGILVGPVVAGVFYAMLKILQAKLARMDIGHSGRAATAQTA